MRVKQSEVEDNRQKYNQEEIVMESEDLENEENEDEEDYDQDNLDGKKKRERRLKEDTDERNYICGCGKSYLSYAALYTHAKTKHQGIFPEGTTNLQKKGKQNSGPNSWQVDSSNCDLLKTYEFNKGFKEFVDMMVGAQNEYKKDSYDCILSFPYEHFQKIEDYQNLLITLEKVRLDLIQDYGEEFLDQMDIIIFEINNYKQLNANVVMSLFLLYISRFVSKAFFKEVALFCILYSKMMNKLGYKGINIQNGNHKNQDYCQSETADAFPEFCNYFIKDYFQEIINGDDLIMNKNKLRYLGQEQNQLLILILLVQKFNDWLGVHKFTNLYIEIYKDQQLQYYQYSFSFVKSQQESLSEYLKGSSERDYQLLASIQSYQD